MRCRMLRRSPGVHDCGGSLACPGSWREHRDLQSARHAGFENAPGVEPAGIVGRQPDGIERQAKHEPQLSTLRFMARPKPLDRGTGRRGDSYVARQIHGQQPRPCTPASLYPATISRCSAFAALIGRSIAPADDSIEGAGGPQGAVAMLSYRYWSRAFHRDPSVPGRSINVNGAWLTVIGVTPPEFFGIQVGNSPDIFVPIQLQPTVSAPENLLHNVKNSETTWLTVMGRIRPGLSHAQVKGDLTPIYAEYALTRMSPADRTAYLSGQEAVIRKHRSGTGRQGLLPIA